MSIWESGYCSHAEYVSGQEFLVKPERLAIEGSYGFMCLARPGLSWEAAGFIVTVADKDPAQSAETPHLVTLEFNGDPDSSEPEKTKTYPFDSDGFVRWPKGTFAEAYLRLYTDGTEDEISSTEAIAKEPLVIASADSVVPVGGY